MIPEDPYHVAPASDLTVEALLGLFEQIWRQYATGKMANAVMSSRLSRSFAQALEVFDGRLFADKPEGRRVKDIRPRLVLTEFGEVSFRRRVYVDEFGDRRTHLDEVLSLPTRRRLSPCAFPSLSRFASASPTSGPPKCSSGAAAPASRG